MQQHPAALQSRAHHEKTRYFQSCALTPIHSPTSLASATSLQPAGADHPDKFRSSEDVFAALEYLCRQGTVLKVLSESGAIYLKANLEQTFSNLGDENELK